MIADPLAIWERYKLYFTDDLRHRLGQASADFPLVLLYPYYNYGLFLL